jgi:hypothetical protein
MRDAVVAEEEVVLGTVVAEINLKTPILHLHQLQKIKI